MKNLIILSIILSSSLVYAEIQPQWQKFRAEANQHLEKHEPVVVFAAGAGTFLATMLSWKITRAFPKTILSATMVAATAYALNQNPELVPAPIREKLKL